MRIESARQIFGNAGGADIVSDVAFDIGGMQSEGTESLGKNLAGMLTGEKKRR